MVHCCARLEVCHKGRATSALVVDGAELDQRQAEFSNQRPQRLVEEVREMTVTSTDALQWRQQLMPLCANVHPLSNPF